MLKMHTLTPSDPVHAAVWLTGLQIQVLNIKLQNSESQKQRFVNEVIIISKARQAQKPLRPPADSPVPTVGHRE